MQLATFGTWGSTFVARNCKLPASWAGATVEPASTNGLQVYDMANCDSAATNYRRIWPCIRGATYTETTLVRTGGANDGVTPLSWRVVSNTGAQYPSLPCESPDVVRWNDAVGGSITATLEILHDSATNLTDKEVWVEVSYLADSGSPKGAFVNDSQPNVLGTAADQTASSETWTTTGMSNPNKQKLSVTFTPQMKGFIRAKVFLAKASKTIYVDPVLTVT